MAFENCPLFSIANIDRLNVEAIAPVQLSGKIKKGTQAEVVPEEPIDGKHTPG